MKLLLFLYLALVLAACNSSSSPATHRQIRTVAPDFALNAFGGRLLGTDNGEWGGSLSFQDAGGNVRVLLTQNVHGIVQNSAGIFVFVGLAHLHSNTGYVYRIKRGLNNLPQAQLLSRLPGAPSNVHSASGGATSFLVFSGNFSKDGSQIYDCYELTGAVVTRGMDCRPSGMGSNNSFKPNPLRGSA